MTGKIRFLLPALSLAALAVPATAAATAPPAQAACPAAIVIGLHGVDEPADSARSATIAATFSDFAVDASAFGHGSATSGNYILDPFTYPVVPRGDFTSAAGLKHLSATLDSTVISLATQVVDLKAACPSAAIELAGYSLGAWIIHMALQSTSLWADIRAAEYYGDPCWYNPSGGYIGLARFDGSDGTRVGCSAEGVYPYPDQPPSFQVQSLCIGRDPVCGQGLNPSMSPAKVIARFRLAENCTARDHCTHLDYAGSAAAEGARFLEGEAFGNAG